MKTIHGLSLLSLEPFIRFDSVLRAGYVLKIHLVVNQSEMGRCRIMGFKTSETIGDEFIQFNLSFGYTGPKFEVTFQLKFLN